MGFRQEHLWYLYAITLTRAMVVMWAKTSTTTTTAMLYILLSFWTLNLFDSSFGAGINIRK